MKKLNEDPVEEIFEIDVLQRPRQNFWKYLSLFLILSFSILVISILPAKEKSLIGNIKSAFSASLLNIFEIQTGETVVEVIDLNKEGSKPRKKYIAPQTKENEEEAHKNLAIGTIKIESIKIPENHSSPQKPQENTTSENSLAAPSSISPTTTTSNTPPEIGSETTNSQNLEQNVPIKDVLISEILFNPEGGDKGYEFIELYNPNSIDINLKGWALRLSAIDSTQSNSLAKIGSSESDETVIKAQGFLLVGLNGYSGNPSPDVKRSATLPNAAGTIYLSNAEGKTIETVSYNESIPEGQSLERESYENQNFRNQPNPNPKNSN